MQVVAARVVIASLLLTAGVCSSSAAEALPGFCAPLVAEQPPDSNDTRYGKGLLWRVTREGVPPSYVLGTMHVADPRVTALATVVDGFLKDSARFVMEVVLDPEAAGTLQRAMFNPGGGSLREIAGERLFELTARHLGSYGISADTADTLKPWAAFTTLSMPAGDAGLPLDLVLMMAAQASGKQVVGLETVEEQISIFESIPEEEQVEILREVSCHFDHFQRDIETMVVLYDARDLTGLMRLTLLYPTEEKLELLDALLWRRNVRMVERMAPLVESGSSFIAVGALHLPGRRGILQRLADRGYMVEAIY